MRDYKARGGQKCIVTGERAVDLHHIISRGAGGPDEPWNLAPLSRKAHVEWHQKGRTSMAAKYDTVHQWLVDQKWYFCKVGYRWRHPNFHRG